MPDDNGKVTDDGTMVPPECKCEYADGDAACCGLAQWRVQVGGRQSDAQLACRRHLSATCGVMLSAEGRAGATITVIPLGEW